MKNRKQKKNVTLEVMNTIRIPVAPPTSCHTSKKYNRREKHKKEISHE